MAFGKILSNLGQTRKKVLFGIFFGWCGSIFRVNLIEKKLETRPEYKISLQFPNGLKGGPAFEIGYYLNNPEYFSEHVILEFRPEIPHRS